MTTIRKIIRMPLLVPWICFGLIWVETAVAHAAPLLRVIVPTTLTIGSYHSCALTNGGGVICWGENESGQLGDGETTYRKNPAWVDGLSFGVMAVVAGWDSTCALMSTGAVACWGALVFTDNTGLLSGLRTSPAAVRGLHSGVSVVAVGKAHACAVQNGVVACWGDNTQGQLGNGTTTATPDVQRVNLPESAVSVVAGAMHTCALTSGGQIFCWGQNERGQLGDQSSTDRPAPVAVTLPGAVHQLVAGATHTCALFADSAVTCWGNNSFGELGTGQVEPFATEPQSAVTLSKPIVELVAGGGSLFGYTCALLETGSVSCWGSLLIDDRSTVSEELTLPESFTASTARLLTMRRSNGEPASRLLFASNHKM